MIPHRRYLFLPTYAAAAFCVAFLATRAQAQTPAAAAGATSGKEYALKNVSTFNAPPTDGRNPFWPIGWVPTAPIPTGNATTAVPVADVRADQFTVTSISVDAPALAVINGQTRAVGERILVSGAAGAQDFVTVKRITDGMVILDHKGKELAVASGGASPRKR